MADCPVSCHGRGIGCVRSDDVGRVLGLQSSDWQPTYVFSLPKLLLLYPTIEGRACSEDMVPYRICAVLGTSSFHAGRMHWPFSTSNIFPADSLSIV